MIFSHTDQTSESRSSFILWPGSPLTAVNSPAGHLPWGRRQTFACSTELTLVQLALVTDVLRRTQTQLGAVGCFQAGSAVLTEPFTFSCGGRDVWSQRYDKYSVCVWIWGSTGDVTTRTVLAVVSLVLWWAATGGLVAHVDCAVAIV